MFAYKNIDRSAVWLIIVSALAMSFAWSERLNAIGIVLLVLHWLLDKKLVEKIKSISINVVTISFLLFFFTYFLGLLWSDFPNESFKSIESKLTFLVLPILFSTENYLNKKTKQNLFTFFISSCLLSFFYATIISIYNYHSLGISVVFNRMYFSYAIMHPGYYSNYFAFAFVIVTQHIINTKFKENKLFLVALILLIAVIVLASKTTLLFTAFYLTFLVWQLSNFIKNFIVRLSSYVLVIFISIFAFSFIPSVHERLNEVKTQSNHVIVNPQFANSTESRRAAWNLEWQLIKANPIMGHGTGSANPLLLQKFKEKKYTDLVLNNMHTHNQIFNTWIELGILGVLLLLFFLGTSFRQFFLHKNTVGWWLVVLFFFNCVTDDILSIQAGIVFFNFFLLILLFEKNKFVNRGY